MSVVFFKIRIDHTSTYNMQSETEGQWPNVPEFLYLGSSKSTDLWDVPLNFKYSCRIKGSQLYEYPIIWNKRSIGKTVCLSVESTFKVILNLSLGSFVPNQLKLSRRLRKWISIKKRKAWYHIKFLDKK